jgi:subtilase family serine protease
MQIRFALRNQAALDKLLLDLQNPASPHYHHWLKTGEFARRFGPSKSEVKAVEAWLKSQGFAVSTTSQRDIAFQGDVSQAQQTFEVRIARFGDGSTYANTSDPVVPGRFARVIGAILGMDNIVHAMPLSHRLMTSAASDRLSARNHLKLRLAPAERSSQGPFAQGVSDGSPIGQAILNGDEAFGPADVRTFYDETVANGEDGSGDCIAIVGISDFLDSAMSVFTSKFGLPAIDYTREFHGPNPGINSGGESEAELDLQWAHSTAPGASIVYHLGNDLVSDIAGAVTDNACGAISISYTFCSPTASLIEYTLDPLFKQAAAQGQSVFVSSGDNGAAGDVISGNTCAAGNSRSVNEMSADPNVTSVGGTQFSPTYSGGNNVGYVTEDVWNDGIGASGGGASQFFSKPGYQTGQGVPNDGARDVPDIALLASPEHPGVFWGHDVRGSGEISCCIGGTSLGAPVWAGFSRVVAEMTGTTRLGNLNLVIYGLTNSQYSSAGFHDITIGNNNFNGVTGYSAATGYDQATGWGSVDFNTFALAAESWIKGSTTPTPTSTATPSATATATATATQTAAVTPTSTATTNATPTSAPTSSQTPKPTATPIMTATSVHTATDTVTPTQTTAPTSTPTATTTPNSTPTLAPTASPTPISEPSGGVLRVPGSVHFPTVGIGMQSATRKLVISNRSSASTLRLEVATLASPFEVIGAGQYSLAPLARVTVTIVLTPSVVGTARQSLRISSGDPKHPWANVSIIGTVAAGKLSAPGKVSLMANSGTPTSKTLKLRNSGKGMLSGRVQPFAPGSPLTLMGGPVSFTLAPGQTQPITIEFAPAGGRTFSANLAIDTTPPPASTTIAVVGTVR